MSKNWAFIPGGGVTLLGALLQALKLSQPWTEATAGLAGDDAAVDQTEVDPVAGALQRAAAPGPPPGAAPKRGLWLMPGAQGGPGPAAGNAAGTSSNGSSTSDGDRNHLRARRLIQVTLAQFDYAVLRCTAVLCCAVEPMSCSLQCKSARNGPCTIGACSAAMQLSILAPEG